MGDVLSEGVATTYKRFFVDLAKQYPHAWHIAVQAEMRLRHEWVVDEKRRQEDFFTSNPEVSRFNVARPWGSVLLASIKGIESIEY